MRGIKNILIGLGLFSTSCFAMSEQQAQQILNNLIKVSKASSTKLKIKKDPSVNAECGYFDRIILTSGALALNTNTVAFILAHELAHKMLGHRGSTYSREYAADKLGVQLATKAGYNMCQGIKILLTFKGGKTHAPGIDRYNRVVGVCK